MNSRGNFQGNNRGGYSQNLGKTPVDTTVVDKIITDMKLKGDNIAVTLFSDIAQKAATEIEKDGRKSTSTQIRKFYDELVMWNNRINAPLEAEKRQERYTQHAPFIQMLKAKVAYSKGRDVAGDHFEKLFSGLITKVECPQSLNHAKLFMEAVIGFHKALEKNSNPRD